MFAVKLTVALSVCGIVATDYVTPLIINGKPAAISEFPWHGTLYEAKGNEKRFICNAVIIQDNLLLTAAHCVYDEAKSQMRNPSNYYVAVSNIFRDYDFENHDFEVVQKAKVKNVFIPCNYKGSVGNYAYDIAILQLEKPLILNSLIKPVLLDQNITSNQTGQEIENSGRVVGFGWTETGQISSILQSSTMKYVPLNICKFSSAVSESEKYITIDKFCAESDNGTLCDHISGSGLVFKTNNQWYLRGILSAGIGLKDKGTPGTCQNLMYALYTSVSSHIEWIQNVILHLENDKPFPACS